MRNIYQYPVTAEEVHQVLTSQIQAIVDSKAIGGISAHALARVAEFLTQNDAQFRTFLQQGR